MLRYALRRLLWAIPTLFCVSLVVFFLASLSPDPGPRTAAERAALLASDGTAYETLEEARRSRFLDLPRFFNARPRDVRTAAAEILVHLSADDIEAHVAAHELARLGGAALPEVLPQLDRLAPAARSRVAVALLPVAKRMEIGDDATLRDPRQAPVFWTRFWEDRSVDFTEPAARRAVTRLTSHTTDARERDIRQLDTFALPEVMAEIAAHREPDVLARLTRVAAHATGREVVVEANASPDECERVARDWQMFWDVHRTDYVALGGPERVTATVSETRYGKWIARAATLELGASVRDGEPIWRKLRRHAPLTFTLAALATIISYLLAIPLATLAAWRRGRPIDKGVGLALFTLYSLPTFWLAELVVRLVGTGVGSGRVMLAVLVLSAGTVANLSRYQRSSLLEVLGLDYVRTARAKGVPEWRVILVHALRNAMMPTVTLAGLQLPTLLGGVFVVEEVLGLPGLGFESLRAVESHDAPWLVAMILTTAVVATLGLIASDVAYGLLDPRLRELVVPGRRST